MSEGDLMRRLQIAATRLGARLFRQNTGLAWVGDVRRNRDGSLTIRNPRPFRAGVRGMSDLGGWMPVTVTPEMVGKTVAVYVQIEVKAGTDTTDEQEAWIAVVNKSGGRAGVARSERDLCEILQLR